MEALICELCGGPLAMDSSGEFAICEYCKMKYMKSYLQQKIQMVTGTVETYKGNTEKERILNNAETFFKLESWKKAIETFQTVVDQFPDDWRGWWGLVRIGIIAPVEYKEVYASQSNLENAYKLCPERETMVQYFLYLLKDANYTETCSIRGFIIVHYKALSEFCMLRSSYVWLLMKERIELLQVLQSKEVLNAWYALREECLRRICSGEIVFEGMDLSHLLPDEIRYQNSKIISLLRKDHDLFSLLINKCGCRLEGRDFFWNNINGEIVKTNGDFNIHLILGNMLWFVIGDLDSWGGGYGSHSTFLLLFDKPVTDYLDEIIKMQWRSQNRCQYCGGSFRGLFKQVCSNCRKEKDY